MSAAVTSDWETSDIVVPTVVRATANNNENQRNATSSDEDNDTATATVDAAFGRLRLDASSSSARPLPPQPSPPHALYDPNATYPQPVSPATATAAVARFGQLDPVLLAGLENARERLSLLKFEDQIVRFIKNPREMQLSFPPLSSYHRLIIHRLAERCCLEHQTADFGGYDTNTARVVTLFKTPQTMVPRVLLIDLSADMQPPQVTPAAAPKIMMRKRSAPRGQSAGGRGANGSAENAKNQQRSIEDRERAYAEARARIFGEETTNTESSSSTSTSSATPNATTTPSNSSNAKFGGSAQAAGPDGSRGFGGRGSGGRGNNASSQQQHSRPQREVSPPSGRGTQPSGSHDSGASQRPQNWKESKVLWRNREQELNDPDFTRNHEAYRPSRDPPYGGGGGGGGGRNGGGGYYGYGYQMPPPAYAGRGRGPVPNDFGNSRIDPNLRQQGHMPPPLPPPEYYRHQPSSYHSSYSPHGRGGYAPPPPPPSQQGRRGSGGVSYNDDFPPLGN